MAAPPILTCRNIDKSFGPVRALTGAGVTLAAGHITAIVGENGAGKSTLAKILAGILQADRGEIILNGKPAVFRRRADALAAGIGFVPQSLSFITTLTLAENHLLAKRGLIADRGRAEKELAAAAQELGIDLPFDVPLERLSLPERQLGEIASAVAGGATVLLLDEPTSALGPVEIERLVAAIRRLATAGTAIALVTHRITEVMTGADFVAVLRGGVPLFEGPTAGLDRDEIARMMVGASVPTQTALQPHGDVPRLVVEDISVVVDDVTYVEGIEFELRGGEILGIAGIASNSQTMLAEVLAGLRVPSTGRVALDGTEVTGDARAARHRGLAHIPDDRSTGIVPHLTVAENAALFRTGEPDFTRYGMRRPSAETAHATQIVEATDVRPRRPALLASALSGGNQQKLLVGRELAEKPAVVIAHGPTQGLDLTAAAEIRDRLVDMAAAGAAVLVISADLDEILSLSHGVIVLSNGRVADRFDLRAGPPDMIRLGNAMGGTRRPAAA